MEQQYSMKNEELFCSQPKKQNRFNTSNNRIEELRKVKPLVIHIQEGEKQTIQPETFSIM
jgi:hypothetical protein